MNKFKYLVLTALVVLLASCDDSLENRIDITAPENAQQLFTVVPQSADQVTYKLIEADVQGIQGIITIRDAGIMGVESFMKLENTIPGIMHPVHIHEGLFGNNGDRVITLNPIDGDTGIGRTFFDKKDDGTSTDYYDLTENHEYYVGPHYSMDDMSTIIAAGNIGLNNPPIPCGPCDGKVTALSFIYEGTESARITVEQKRGGIVFDRVVSPQEQFSIDGTDRKGTLSTEIYMSIDGAQVAKIHTSCSIPIGIGYAVSDFIIVAGESRNGGPLCDLDESDIPEPCNTCDGKVTSLSLVYNGSQTVDVKVEQQRGGEIFNQSVDPGDVIQLIGQDNQQTLSSKVYIMVDGRRVEEIHTSCSQPIGPGAIFGDFEVIAGSSRNGGVLCGMP
ncbi:hypothetical protein AAU57_01010 [Nonlabens sp. YIK11]|uniref:DUF7467 domain-containing protein n=1 Tax=Nonlabens sp. YIK11 TaxID=1453349 RepID=UPI0006DCAB4D|nr:hypothetical protein [Nonlabens sp. YIK11]KQC32059.1 hypothetical protein AAU57_01010 [Nonlabens sp. YIK11]